jgi:DNA adenine methylase
VPQVDVSPRPVVVPPFKTQLLKWIGNKQRFAHEIASYFPPVTGTYFEPFLGSGAVLGTLQPERAIGSDVFRPLVEIWQTLSGNPDQLIEWYEERWTRYTEASDRVVAYEAIKASYNESPNGADLLFLSRSCYGGVVRFRKKDGYMSTPCGAHKPITPQSFAGRVELWASRVGGAKFECMDFTEAIDLAGQGDVVYCDPPYSDTQAILYGAQSFRLEVLFEAIAAAKARGAFVALSIDGTKKSGDKICNVHIPDGLFTREVSVNVGRSMLRRFQMGGQSLEAEHVTDRLLLTA